MEENTLKEYLSRMEIFAEGLRAYLMIDPTNVMLPGSNCVGFEMSHVACYIPIGESPGSAEVLALDTLQEAKK